MVIKSKKERNPFFQNPVKSVGSSSWPSPPPLSRSILKGLLSKSGALGTGPKLPPPYFGSGVRGGGGFGSGFGSGIISDDMMRKIRYNKLIQSDLKAGVPKAVAGGTVIPKKRVIENVIPDPIVKINKPNVEYKSAIYKNPLM